MNPSTTNVKPRLYYLDTIKLFACLMVFWTHFTGIFWTLCDVKPENVHPLLLRLFQPPLAFFSDSGMALFVFFILSGYLAGAKRIPTFRTLIHACIGRYIRFVIPFFFMNLCCYILYYAVGFRNYEASVALQNSWLRAYYATPPSVLTVLHSTLFLNGTLNGPLWMMGYMYAGTILIYLHNYLRDRLLSLPFTKSPAIRMLFDVIVLITCSAMLYRTNGTPEQYFMIAFLGVYLRRLEASLPDSPVFLWTLLVLLPLWLESGGLQTTVTSWCYRNAPKLLPFVIWNNFWCIFLSFAFLLFTMKSRWLRAGLSMKAFRFLAPLNFSVYMVHWPLLCTYSLSFYIFFALKLSYNKIFVLCAFTTLLLLFPLSYLCHKTLEAKSEMYAKKMDVLLSSVVS